MVSSPFIAADVGNARIKLGLFESGRCEPLRTLPLAERMTGAGRRSSHSRPDGGDESFQFDHIGSWMADFSQQASEWRIASVNRPSATRLIEWLREHRPDDRTMLLAADDLPLTVRLPRPDMVGIDRLVDAVAANRLRNPKTPAVIVDVGSAITVDLVSGDGVFLGGAIFPGVEMSARALHHFTDLLPMVGASEPGLPVPPVGADTKSAIRAGLYWGAVGAIRQLVRRQGELVDGTPQVFLTGGAGAAMADLLGAGACFVPNLTLMGIALTAMRSCK